MSTEEDKKAAELILERIALVQSDIALWRTGLAGASGQSEYEAIEKELRELKEEEKRLYKLAGLPAPID